MTGLPEIDIVVPVYNHANYLHRCISSALAQTYQPRRIICVDDASPDPKVSEVLAQISSAHERVEVITLSANSGICNAQNVAVSAAKAEYVAFLDCDDWLREDALQVIASALASERAGYAFSDRVDVNESAGTQNIRSYGGQPQLRHARSHKDNLLDHMVASHLKVIKRDLVKEVGGFIEGTDGVQDWDVALKISEIASLVHVPEAVYFHRVHTGQNSSYDNVVNMRKTNAVRRAAQIRRFVQTSRGNDEFRLPPLIDKLVRGAPIFLETISNSEGLLVLNADGSTQFLPQSRGCVRDLISNAPPAEVLVFGRRQLYLDLLKDLWDVSPRPILGFYLAEFDGFIPSIHSCRWSNSYFDYVLCNSSEGHISLLGYTHPDLKILVQAAEEPSAERTNA